MSKFLSSIFLCLQIQRQEPLIMAAKSPFKNCKATFKAMYVDFGFFFHILFRSFPLTTLVPPYNKVAFFLFKIAAH